MNASHAHDDSLTRRYLVALASAVILSTTAIFIRYLTQTYQMPPLLLAAWRGLFVTITLLLALGWQRPLLLRTARRHLPYLSVHGLVLAGFNSLWTLSVALNGAAVATVLLYSSAAFTALLARWLLRERLDWAKMVAVALCLAGCVLVADALNPGVWAVNPLGILTGIGSGLAYAAYSLMGRAAAQRGFNPWTLLLYTFAFATVYMFTANLLPGEALPGTAVVVADLLWLGQSWPGWGILILLAAGPTVAGFGLYNVSLSLLPSSVANLILTSEPVFTAVLAYLLLGERLAAVQIGGSAMILGGVIFLRWYNGRMARHALPAPAD